MRSLPAQKERADPFGPARFGGVAGYVLYWTLAFFNFSQIVTDILYH